MTSATTPRRDEDPRALYRTTTLYAVRRMPYVEVSSDGTRYAVYQDKWPADPALREKCFHISLKVCYTISFPVDDFALISVYCLLTVVPETYLSQQRSAHIQMSDVFSRGSRCLAHSGYIFIECAIVSSAIYQEQGSRSDERGPGE